jgi:hypothetical protein
MDGGGGVGGGMGPVGGGVGGMVGPVGVGGGGGGSDVELVSKTLQFEHKLFYFDLKENPRGRYLKISEKTSTTRSTIIVPIAGVAWFLDLFDYYIRTDERDVFSKELRLDTKVRSPSPRLICLTLAGFALAVAKFSVGSLFLALCRCSTSILGRTREAATLR